ncbi:MAG: YegP family protein [Winogradskyella sp.]
MGFPKFIIRKSSNNLFYFNLYAVNGVVILNSETYTTKQNCIGGVASVKVHAPFDNNYVRKVASNGQYYFNIKATNGEVIGTSEMYNSSQARDNGINAVKRDAPIADTEDNS